MLIGLQIGLSWLGISSSRLERLVNGACAIVPCGPFCWTTMKRERGTEEKIRAPIRSKDISSIEAVDSVVLEPTGR